MVSEVTTSLVYRLLKETRKQRQRGDIIWLCLTNSVDSTTNEEENKNSTKADGVHRERECVKKNSQNWTKKNRFWEVVVSLEKICCLSEQSNRLEETTDSG
jgi:hypothetical protein